MNKVQIWAHAARPKTLFASISPILVGTTLALQHGQFNLLLFLATLFTGLGIQIGTNVANDYFDFLKGADTSERKGPLRVTAAGLVSLRTMRRAIVLIWGCTILVGLILVYQGGIAIALLLALAVLLGILYTGGPYPLAYLGLGELFVLVFGPVAVCSTYFLQTHTVSAQALLAGISQGLLATAIIIVANTRDIKEDSKTNKRTLQVRFGEKFGKQMYISAILLSLIPPLFLFRSFPFSLLAILALIPAIPLMRAMWQNEDPHFYNILLAKTGQLLLIFTLLFCIGMSIPSI